MNLQLSEIGKGALQELFEIEMKSIFENVDDPNTDATKTRKMQINLTIKPNKLRDLADVEFSIKTTLAPSKPLETYIAFGKDRDGGIKADEIIKGQLPGQSVMSENIVAMDK